MKKIIMLMLMLSSLLVNGQVINDTASLIKLYKSELENFGKSKSEVDSEVSNFRKGLFKKQNVSAKFASAVKDLSGILPVTPLCVDNVFENGTNPWSEFCLHHYSAVPAYLPNGLSNAICNPLSKNGLGSGQHYLQIIPFAIDPFLLSASPSFSLPSRPLGGGSNSLRLGNKNNGNGSEMIAKNILVTNANKIFYFKYALVMEKSHSNLDGSPNGSEVFFSARALDAANNVVDEVLQIGNPNNSFTQKTNSNSIYFVDWQCAKLDLSSKVGQTVKIEFINSDCSGGAHWGYTYLDEFCKECKTSEEASVKVDSCFNNSNVTGSFTPPSIGGSAGVLQSLELQFYNNGVPIGPLFTTYTTSGSTYSFSGITMPSGFSCLDAVVTAKFQITNPFSGNTSILIKSTSNKDVAGKEVGYKPGINNDVCICCQCLQEIKPTLVWFTGIGTGTRNELPIKCGETYTDILKCYQPYLLQVQNPCGNNCEPDSMITTIQGPTGPPLISYSTGSTSITANQVGTYTVTIKVKCGGKWCKECKFKFVQTKNCEPPCDNCKDKVSFVFDSGLSSLDINTFPLATTVNATFVLGGGADTYTQIRANVVDFQISSDNPACLQCYNIPNQWGSIISGSIPSFTSAITTYPSVAASNANNSPREILFNAATPTAIPMGTNLNLAIKVPGLNPISCCCIKVVLYVKITYRNNKCEECTKIVRVAFTQCPNGDNATGNPSTGFEPDGGEPHFKMHSPNKEDTKITNKAGYIGHVTLLK